MLPQVHPLPLHLRIPKYIPDYSKISQYYTDISAVVSPVDSPPSDDHNIPSPQSPPEYDYVSRSTDSFHSNPTPAQIYDDPTGAPSYTTHPHNYSASNAETSGYIINSSSGLRDSDAVGQYLSDSPSPVDVHPPSSLSHPSSAPHSQDRFPHSPQPQYPGADRTSAHLDFDSDRCSRTAQMDKYPGIQPQNLDQRRMSEPAALSGNHLYHPSTVNINSNSRHQQFQFSYNPPPLNGARSPTSMYLSSLHRGASTGSLRDLRHQHFHYPPLNNDWKEEETHATHREDLEYYDRAGGLDAPISPLQPNFSGGLVSPTSGLPYSPLSENLYGPSPPGTGTSTSSSGPLSAGVPSRQSHHFPHYAHQRSVSGTSSSGDAADRKNYAFISLPGNAVKKRPRRRYDEIERLYQCSWPECTKSYGTLNHLNAHVTMQKHGSKRSPNEFKELRKQWRKAKKEADGQTPAPMRRSSFTGRREEFDYDIRFGLGHSPRHHTFHHSGNEFQPTVGITHSGVSERYPVGVEDIRFPLNDRDEQMHYGPLTARQRYSSSLPASWHGGSPLSSRNLPQSYVSSSLPNHHAHHSQLPHLTIATTSHPQSLPMPPSPPRIAMNRLPADSTLLTPLPVYQVQAHITGADNIGYGVDVYEVYENDGSRPGTGHASLGQGSSDEYDHRS